MSRQKERVDPIDYGAELEKELGAEEFNSVVIIIGLVLKKYGILHRPPDVQKAFQVYVGNGLPLGQAEQKSRREPEKIDPCAPDTCATFSERAPDSGKTP